MIKIGPRVSRRNAEWYEKHFKSRTTGCQYILEKFPEVYNDHIKKLLSSKKDPSKLTKLDVIILDIYYNKYQVET